jgi:hypothetical protein
VLQTNHLGFNGEGSDVALPPTHPRDSDPAPFAAQINPVALAPSLRSDPFEPPAQSGGGMRRSRAIPIRKPSLYRRESQSDEGLSSSPEQADGSSSSSSRPPSSLSFSSSCIAQRVPGSSHRHSRLRQDTRSSSDSEGAGKCCVQFTTDVPFH